MKEIAPIVKNVFILLLAGIGLSLLPSDGISCTLFGAIGNAVEGGGILIGKTRDRRQQFEQVFVDFQPQEGFRYRGVSTKGKLVTSGMNEKGLVVVSAAASNVERTRDRITSSGRILSKASSVEEVLRMLKKREIKGPVHFLVGDLRKIALIEVTGEGQYGVEIKENGTLCHTNHFVLEPMKKFNPRVGPSSQARFDRIRTLLANEFYSREAFIAFARDHKNGPGDLSVCRHVEDKSRKTDRTISAAIYYIPGEGPPEMWVSLGQPCQSLFEKK